ncbi:hypothetical protein F4778DRAFT_7669 [Xylariomycetidae sp. FL2044]|nr:hypothetical protein F4778DRAFT_7669 [Xylariomycetidae sp. FL2044]
MLILDRALNKTTSDINAETDQLMHYIIRDEPGQHILMSLAHRLHMNKDADAILVVDQREMVSACLPWRKAGDM